MHIVIEIPEEYYNDICSSETVSNYSVLYVLYGIRNGTPLPKGHGRLIDADAYIDKHEECGWLDDIALNEFNTITPTVIEADKGE